MQPWVWLTPYIIGFGLLQVLLYRQFSERRSSPTDGQVTQGDGGRTIESSTAEAVTCKHCGAVNEVNRMIRFCRVCTESVGD